MVLSRAIGPLYACSYFWRHYAEFESKSTECRPPDSRVWWRRRSETCALTFQVLSVLPSCRCIVSARRWPILATLHGVCREALSLCHFAARRDQWPAMVWRMYSCSSSVIPNILNTSSLLNITALSTALG